MTVGDNADGKDGSIQQKKPPDVHFSAKQNKKLKRLLFPFVPEKQADDPQTVRCRPCDDGCVAGV